MKYPPCSVITGATSDANQKLIPVSDVTGLIGFLNMHNRKLWKPNITMKKGFRVHQYSILEYISESPIKMSEVEPGNIIEICVASRKYIAVLVDYSTINGLKVYTPMLVLLKSVVIDGKTIHANKIFSATEWQNSLVSRLSEITMCISEEKNV